MDYMIIEDSSNLPYTYQGSHDTSHERGAPDRVGFSATRLWIEGPVAGARAVERGGRKSRPRRLRSNQR